MLPQQHLVTSFTVSSAKLTLLIGETWSPGIDFAHVPLGDVHYTQELPDPGSQGLEVASGSRAGEIWLTRPSMKLCIQIVPIGRCVAKRTGTCMCELPEGGEAEAMTG